jgi:integrase
MAEAVRCPECGSNRLYKDGIRYSRSNRQVQRYLCRDCGYRFSEPKIKVNVIGKIRKALNPGSDLAEKMVSDGNFLAEKSSDGFPFLSGKDVRAHGSKPQITIIGKGLNTFRHYNSKHRVCAQKDAKNLDTAAKTKTVAGDLEKLPQEQKGKLVEYAWKLKKRGLQENTISIRTYLLNQLVKLGADLNKPDSVETVLATEKFTRSKKHQLVATYRSFTKVFKIPWEPIKASYHPKQPHIPLETELDQLIAASGKRTAAFLQTLKDTGARCGEIARLEWADINEANLTVRINNAEKGSLSRTVRVTEKTIAMIKKLSQKYAPLVFNPNTRIYKNAVMATRRRLARTLQEPRFNLIHLHSFRHWKATTEYAKTRDILHVMKLLGHKNIRNTIIYTQLAEFKNEEYHSAVAENIEEARELIESGFSFVCDIEGAKLFSKRK